MTIEILTGDCIDHMRNVIAPASVHCIVSSPPYWGLRDYGIPPRTWQDGTSCVYGNEPTVAEYITHTQELFDAMRRILRPDGVIWWNIGDTFITGAGKAKSPGGGSRGENWKGEATQPNRMPQSISAGNKGLLPHRVAIGLQDAGWCIRQDNIWAKPAPMPESMAGWFWQRCTVKTKFSKRANPGTYHADAHEKPHGARDGKNFDSHAEETPCPGCDKCTPNGGYVLRQGKWRHTNAHEYIFQITQGGHYFCDAAAAAEKAVGGAPGNKTHKGATAYAEGDVKMRTKVGLCQMGAVSQRNPRSVWRFAAESFKGAHFATFPTELPYLCINSSTSSAGVCPHCGRQWAPVIEKIRRPTRPGETTKVHVPSGWNTGEGSHGSIHPDGRSQTPEYRDSAVVGNRDPLRHCTDTIVSEYRPTCSCPAHVPIPATVYDPFGGSLTTAAVAHHMGRHAITSEINPSYIGLGDARLARRPKCLTIRDPKSTRKPRRKIIKTQRELFAEATNS